MRVTALLTAALFSLFTLTGCGVSSDQEAKIAQVVAAQLPDFEKTAQASIKTHKNFAEIRDGSWQWRYEKGDDGRFNAHYGYYGKNPWWKIILGGLIGITVSVVTLGTIYWSPWGMDSSVFMTVDVDLKAGTARLTEKK